LIKVLICDDQEIVRKGLNIILTHAEEIEVVGLAENGQEACKMAAELNPDVILMDLKMPLLNGVQATAKIKAAASDDMTQLILVLTTYDADDWVFDAIRAGASGYLLKDTDGDEILHAIRETAVGRSHLDSRIAGKVLQEFRRIETAPILAPKGKTKREKTKPDPKFDSLTEREVSILEQMSLGKTNSEIAEALFLAEGTVKNNVSQIIQKLHANSRTQAILAALRSGLVDL
jgi:DNA-binding NarL/FixJ family response regulator